MSSELDLTSHGTFGTCLKQLMQTHGVTRDTLAREIGLSRPETISNWCRGQPPTRSAEYFPKIRKALNLDDATYARLVRLACFDQKTREKLLKGVRNADTAIRELPMKETQPQKRALAFTEQYPNLAPYWRHMETLLREHLSGFVEREEVVAGFKAFIDQHASGYFLLEAEAGLGKTALAAMFVKRFGAITHFFSAPQGITHMGKGLNFLNAQLCFTYDLALPLLPDTAGEANQVFAELLDRISGRITKVFFVIDALDEAEGRIYLPPDLPKGVYGILTFRPGLLLPGIVAPSTTWKLEANNAEQRASLTEYILQAEYLAAIRNGTARDDSDKLGAWGQQVVAACQGNFMYAHCLAAEQPELEMEMATLPAILPQGLRAYYAEFWREFTALRDTAPTEWRMLYQPTLGYLLAAGEPVTTAWLATHVGESEGTITNEVLARWRRLLHYDQETKCCSFLHTSLWQYLMEQLPALSYRQALMKHYLNHPVRWEDHKGYALRHLPRLIQECGHPAQLGKLLLDYNWWSAQQKTDPMGQAYRQDVARGITWVETMDQAGLPWLTAWSLLAALASESSTLPLAALEAWVYQGQLTAAWQALARIPDDWTRVVYYRRLRQLALDLGKMGPRAPIPAWIEPKAETQITSLTLAINLELARLRLAEGEPEPAQALLTITEARIQGWSTAIERAWLWALVVPVYVQLGRTTAARKALETAQTLWLESTGISPTRIRAGAALARGWEALKDLEAATEQTLAVLATLAEALDAEVETTAFMILLLELRLWEQPVWAPTTALLVEGNRLIGLTEDSTCLAELLPLAVTCGDAADFLRLGNMNLPEAWPEDATDWEWGAYIANTWLKEAWQVCSAAPRLDVGDIPGARRHLEHRTNILPEDWHADYQFQGEPIVLASAWAQVARAWAQLGQADEAAAAVTEVQFWMGRFATTRQHQGVDLWAEITTAAHTDSVNTARYSAWRTALAQNAVAEVWAETQTDSATWSELGALSNDLFQTQREAEGVWWLQKCLTRARAVDATEVLRCVLALRPTLQRLGCWSDTLMQLQNVKQSWGTRTRKDRGHNLA